MRYKELALLLISLALVGCSKTGTNSINTDDSISVSDNAIKEEPKVIIETEDNTRMEFEDDKYSIANFIVNRKAIGILETTSMVGLGFRPSDSNIVAFCGCPEDDSYNSFLKSLNDYTAFYDEDNAEIDVYFYNDTDEDKHYSDVKVTKMVTKVPDSKIIIYSEDGDYRIKIGETTKSDIDNSHIDFNFKNNSSYVLLMHKMDDVTWYIDDDVEYSIGSYYFAVKIGFDKNDVVDAITIQDNYYVEEARIPADKE